MRVFFLWVVEADCGLDAISKTKNHDKENIEDEAFGYPNALNETTFNKINTYNNKKKKKCFYNNNFQTDWETISYKHRNQFPSTNIEVSNFFLLFRSISKIQFSHFWLASFSIVYFVFVFVFSIFNANEWLMMTKQKCFVENNKTKRTAKSKLFCKLAFHQIHRDSPKKKIPKRTEDPIYCTNRFRCTKCN